MHDLIKFKNPENVSLEVDKLEYYYVQHVIFI